MKTDGERIEALVQKLGGWMEENDLPFHYGYPRSVWETWAEIKVRNFHKVVGLNLDLMEGVDFGSLGHDINGICAYWNTHSESMDNWFSPRCTDYGRVRSE